VKGNKKIKEFFLHLFFQKILSISFFNCLMVALLGLGHQIYSHPFTRIKVQNTKMNLKK
jgi:hypothetical protein